MIKALHELWGAGLLAATLAVTTLTVSACSNSAAEAPAMQSGAQRWPLLPSGATDYKFVTVNYPSAALTEVTGINNSNGIIGTYQNYSSSDFKSFTSSYPYKGFSQENFSAESVVMQSTATYSSSGTTIEAGWAINPSGQAKGTYGLIHDPNSNWDYLRKRDEGKGCVFMQLFGINEVGVAVGYYKPTNASGTGCTQVDLLYSSAENQYETNLGPTSGNPVITGINNLADLVGYMQPASGPEEGWYMLCKGGATEEGCSKGYGPVEEFALKGEQTVLNGINDKRLVVGTVSSAYGSVGFIENATVGSSSVQYIIADPNLGTSTFLNGINNNDYICGWYSILGEDYEGFVGEPKTQPRRR